jgi:hypothetical protein
MSTQRVAFSCALATLILFSCNNKKNRINSLNSAESTKQFDTVTIFPDEPLDISTYNTRFIDGATQRFTAHENKISVITAKGKLKVIINPSVLEKEDGSAVDGKINVSIIELTNSDDLFKSNAATISDERLLASGGSYFIGMESDGKKLRIKKGNIMEVNFPLLNDDEMELFYGERDSTGIMNWKQAGKQLQQEFETISFNTGSDYIPRPTMPEISGMKINYYLFNSLDSKVFFSNRLMTIRELVAELKSKGIERVIDTVYYSWYGRGHQVIYSLDSTSRGILHGRQFRLISPKVLQLEKDSLKELICTQKELFARQTAEYEKKMGEWKQNDFKEQLKKYYAPATITSLGWINCDRFYKKDQIDVDLDIPITLNNSRIEYFVIFRSFSGLVNYKVDFNEQTKVILKNMPVGEPVTLIAFAKNKGIIYEGKKDFIIEKNKKVPVEFRVISQEELSKTFRNNVKG